MDERLGVGQVHGLELLPEEAGLQPPSLELEILQKRPHELSRTGRCRRPGERGGLEARFGNADALRMRAEDRAEMAGAAPRAPTDEHGPELGLGHGRRASSASTRSAAPLTPGVRLTRAARARAAAAKSGSLSSRRDASWTAPFARA